MNRTMKFGLLAALLVLAVFAIAGHPLIPQDMLAGLGAAGMIPFAGEIDAKGLAAAMDAQSRAFEEFKKTQDEKLAKLAKGESVSDLEAKLSKMNDAMNESAKELKELSLKASREQITAGADGKKLTPEQAEYKKALNAYLRSGEGDGKALKELGQKAMNSNSDPNGGYLVLPEMDMAIDRVVGTIGVMSRLADTITIGTQKWEKMVKTAGMAMRRVANGGTGGETTEPTFAKVEIEAFPAEVEPWVFNETLDDARIDLESDLAMEAGIGFAEGANAEFINGTGVGSARGILGYSNVVNSAYSWGSVGYVRSGKSGAFMSVAPSDRMVSLQHSLKSQYRPGAVWVTNDTTLGVMRQMKDGSGSYYLWQPDPAAAFGGRFLGSPVEIDDNMPALGAGSYSLAYGNFKRAYKVVNRAGTSLIRDNITTKGQTKFNFRRRFGGGIVNYEALKLMAFVTGAAV